MSKIVMDVKNGELTCHWHHADEPSEPITFGPQFEKVPGGFVWKPNERVDPENRKGHR
jgi:hypothetical protein